jgi:hypothetical protein
MRLSYVNLLLWMALMCPTCLAEERGVVINGAFWHTLTKAEKGFFVAGYVVGNQLGFAQGRAAAVNDLMDIHGVAGARAERALKTTNNLDAGPFTFGQISDGVDECYKDFRNREVEVDMCIAWAVDGIQGDDDKSREAFLESVRESEAAAKAKAKASQ